MNFETLFFYRKTVGSKRLLLVFRVICQFCTIDIIAVLYYPFVAKRLPRKVAFFIILSKTAIYKLQTHWRVLVFATPYGGGTQTFRRTTFGYLFIGVGVYIYRYK